MEILNRNGFKDQQELICAEHFSDAAHIGKRSAKADGHEL